MDSPCIEMRDRRHNGLCMYEIIVLSAVAKNYFRISLSFFIV